MITVLVRARRGPEALAVTLSALVPAVAAGLVGDAVVLSESPDRAVERVADAAGATLIAGHGASWREGARVARHEWLLCLDDGDVPEEGWIRVLERFVALGPRAGRLGRLRRRHPGILPGLRDLVRGLARRGEVRAGDLVHRRVLLEGQRPGRPVRIAAAVARDPAFG
ncbi:glycosyltransferase family 2 protein [Microvirga thermotolerans]|uniref:Glycosyltransferase n=1 Tax=Microvirga thermotolerans TaxID=2651334 RepID=A0A5P9JUI2_9HYPH|nr:hypothetical protein [Microvirga thermotolerans]QFU15829.1 hypothetical protein GDR74_06100 [Microvirga thermotolerans]